MENETHRINGAKINFNTVSDPELLAIAGHTAERAHQFNREHTLVMGYIATRGLLQPQDGVVEEERFGRGEE